MKTIKQQNDDECLQFCNRSHENISLKKNLKSRFQLTAKIIIIILFRLFCCLVVATHINLSLFNDHIHMYIIIRQKQEILRRNGKYTNCMLN